MPKVRQLEMVAPTRFRARLEEPELREDAALILDSLRATHS